MEAVPRILWGPTNDNVLDVGWPLLDVVARRRWRPGSKLDVFPSGARESLVTGRDYAIACGIPWIPGQNAGDVAATPWSGPTGVEAFIAWCEDGGSFRFVPDINWPLAYVDGCHLDAPDQDTPQPEQDGTYKLPVTITHPTQDLHLLSRRGMFFEYMPGAWDREPSHFSFARASSAYQQLAPGTWLSAAANVVRERESEGSLRTTLLERAGANKLAAPGDLNNAAWIKVGVTTTPNQLADPSGAVTLAKVLASAGAGNHLVAEGPGTVIGPLGGAVVLGGGTHIYAKLLIQNATDGPVAFCILNLTTGAVIASSGAGKFRVRQSSTPAGQILWRVEVAGAQTITNSSYYVMLADATGAENWTAAGTEYIYAGLCQLEEAAWPGSYASVSRSADSLKAPWPYVPQAGWALIEVVERGLLAANTPNANGGWFTISVPGSPSLFLVQETGPQISLYHRQATGDARSIVSSAALGGVLRGDTLRMLARLFADGSVELIVNKNGSAAVSGGRSAALALAPAWGDASLAINQYATSPGMGAYLRVRCGFGEAVGTIPQAQAK